MTGNNFNQLRFDILEKVRLHPQQPGIGTLLELDLYPDVEMEDQETHLKIQGYLRLNGSYLGAEVLPDNTGEERSEPEASSEEEEGEKADIAYVIPVEITLPANRADMDHITSEIESFDYHVLSPFELQIEAVLVINGLVDEPKSEADASPTFEVVERHRFPGHAFSEQEPDAAPEPKEELSVSQSEETEPDDYEFVHVARFDGAPPEEEHEEEDLRPSADSACPEEMNSAETEDSGPSQHVPSEDDGEQGGEYETALEQSDAMEDSGDDGSSGSEEEAGEEGENESVRSFGQGMKVALNPQRSVEDRKDFKLTDKFLREPNPTEFDFQELNKRDRDPFGMEEEEPTRTRPPSGDGDFQEATLQVEEEPAADAETEEPGDEKKSSGTSLDWARWMIGEEQDQFVKLRLVIVQKEDSIDSIAERYEVPASKILHLNRLKSDVLEAGQIVYIPEK